MIVIVCTGEGEAAFGEAEGDQGPNRRDEDAETARGRDREAEEAS